MLKKEFTTAHLEEIDGKQYFVASDDTVDREGEVIAVDGWDLKNFKRNPVVLWSHDPKEPIGVAESIGFKNINGKKKLVYVPKFHDITQKAREIGQMVKEGWIHTSSVGFVGKEMSSDGATFLKQELLEISFVAVPANPNATALALAKGISAETIKEVFVEEKEPEKKEEKSPACRLSGETQDECMSRKIPEIMDEDPNMKQDQAIAIAASYCSKLCDDLDTDKSVNSTDPDIKDVEYVSNDELSKVLDKISEMSDDIKALKTALNKGAEKGRSNNGEVVRRLSVAIQKQSESLTREKNPRIVNNVSKNITKLAEILIRGNK